MKALERDLRVFEIARRLGVGDSPNSLEAILGFCRRLVDKWAHEAGGVGSIQDLEGLVCRRLNLEVQEFRRQDELERVVREQVAAGDVVFASLPALFDDETFATLIRCRSKGSETGPKYMAVIDRRGHKASRGWFSRWHEIAHLLTLNVPTDAQPVHRSTSERSAVERLMDVIAADIGFYEPLFAPIFSARVGSRGRLDFAAVDQIRREYAPEASFQSTVIACLKRWPKPAVHLEAGLGFTAVEARRFDQEPIPAQRPVPKLRVLKAVGNDAAQGAGLRFARNMRVPQASFLHGLFFSRETVPDNARISMVEDLGQWQYSNGRSPPSCQVEIEARPGRQHLEALIQPV